jgi:hypothetical protein
MSYPKRKPPKATKMASTMALRLLGRDMTSLIEPPAYPGMVEVAVLAVECGGVW